MWSISVFVKYSLSAFYCSDKFVGLDHSVWGLCPDSLYDFAIILSYIHLENSNHLNNNNKNNKNSGEKKKKPQNNTTKNKQQQNTKPNQWEGQILFWHQNFAV